MAATADRTVPDDESRAARPTSEPPAARRAARGEVMSYGEGRVCAATACTTRLSRYNDTSYCPQHDDGERGRHRRT